MLIRRSERMAWIEFRSDTLTVEASSNSVDLAVGPALGSVELRIWLSPSRRCRAVLTPAEARTYAAKIIKAAAAADKGGGK